MTHAMTTMPKYESYKDSGVEWIGDIPEHWNIKKLKHIARIETGTTPSTSIDNYYSGGKVLWIKPDNLNEFNLIKDTEQKLTDSGVKQSRLVPPYSSMICGIGTIGKFGYSEEYACTNQQIHSIIYNKGLCNLRYSLFLSFSLTEELKRQSEKVVVSILNKTKMGNVYVAMPPRDEQDRIVTFLDEKTVQIDEAIGIKERQISLLKERKQIIIQNAVTKGLNPNAPMKDSGVDWIGDIPAHWETTPNKRLFSIRKEIVGKKSSDFDLLSLTLKGIIKRDMDNPEGKFPAEFDTYQIVYKNDFVFCLFDVEETPRTIGLSQHYGMITGAYTVMQLMDSVNPEYIEQLYIVIDQQKKFKSLYKGLRNTIPKDVFGCIKTPIPPRREQDEIVEFISQKNFAFEKVFNALNQQINNLKEYKASLINSAVTGKIKVI